MQEPEGMLNSLEIARKTSTVGHKGMNAANMAGKYNGSQAKTQEQNSTAIFSPCGCYTLNSCGNDAPVCLPEAITYLGTVQTIYNLLMSAVWYKICLQ